MEMIPAGEAEWRSLQPNEFVIEVDLRDGARPRLLEGTGLLRQNEATDWYRFVSGMVEAEQPATLQPIGVMEIGYEYLVTVTEEPRRIDLQQVSLAQVGDPSQLRANVRREVANRFKQSLLDSAEYQLVYNALIELTAQMRVAYTPEAEASLWGHLNQVRMQLDDLRTRIESQRADVYDIQGGLLQVRLFLTRVALAPEWEERLKELERKLQESRQHYELRMDVERQQALAAMEAFLAAHAKSEGLFATREQRTEFIERFWQRFFQPQARPDGRPAVLTSGQPSSHTGQSGGGGSFGPDVEAAMKPLGAKLEQALELFVDPGEALQSVLSSIRLARVLSGSEIQRLFTEWHARRAAQFRVTDAPGLLRLFLRELCDAEYRLLP